MLATFDHVNQQTRVIFAIHVTFMTVFMTWLFFLVRSHVFVIGKVAEAILVSTFDSLGSLSGYGVLVAIPGCL